MRRDFLLLLWPDELSSFTHVSPMKLSWTQENGKSYLKLHLANYNKMMILNFIKIPVFSQIWFPSFCFQQSIILTFLMGSWCSSPRGNLCTAGLYSVSSPVTPVPPSPSTSWSSPIWESSISLFAVIFYLLFIYS